MIVFLIVILLLAALMEWLSLRGGAACADGDFSLSKTRAEADEPVEMTVSARNTGRLPITYLALRIAFPPAADLPDTADARMERSLRVVTETFRLWGRSAKERTLRFCISARGVHTLSGRELARGDFLGLRLISRQLDRRQVLLVYPRRLESPALAEAVGNDCGAMSARRWLLRDPVLTLGVREYTGTEPMRTISWSQTARRGELMVREFDYTRTLNCAVLLSVCGLGADEDALRALMDAQAAPGELNAYGRFDALMKTVDPKKAAAFFTAVEGRPVTVFAANLATDRYFRRFILSGGFPVPDVAGGRTAPAAGGADPYEYAEAATEDLVDGH